MLIPNCSNINDPTQSIKEFGSCVGLGHPLAKK